MRRSRASPVRLQSEILSGGRVRRAVRSICGLSVQDMYE